MHLEVDSAGQRRARAARTYARPYGRARGGPIFLKTRARAPGQSGRQLRGAN